MLKKSFVFLVVAVLFCSSVFADTIVVEINESEGSRFPIAVPSFITEKGKTAGGSAKKMHALLMKDLGIAGLFDVWDESRLPGDNYDLRNIDFKKWQALEIQAIITGAVGKVDGQSVIRLRLYDVSDGKLLVGKQYPIKGKKYIDAIHRFADAAIKGLTGKRGPFESKIVASCGAPGKERIVAFDVDGERRWGFKTTTQNNVSPAWSPDASQVAYMGRIKTGETHIYITGGGNPKQVTTYGTVNITPAWTGDGSRLVISSNRNGDTELYLVGLNGKVLQQLTKSYGEDLSPTVSPTGQMVYSSARAGLMHLFKTGVGGGGHTRMTYVGRYNEQPDWSPDGRKIVFSSGGGRQDIFVMESDGSNIVRLTGGNGSNASPSWSPDGRYIAFNSSRGGVFVMREDGSNESLIEKTGGCKNPDWSPWLSKDND